jgi:hypothetical protein
MPDAFEDEQTWRRQRAMSLMRYMASLNAEVTGQGKLRGVAERNLGDGLCA